MAEILDTLIPTVGVNYPDKPSKFLRESARIVSEALMEIENLYYRADPVAYRAWACQWSVEYGVLWRPCDEWDEGDLLWLDEFIPYDLDPES